ncbi:MurR/RpiR family transcriptional regulator [bacterium]|nr:MurR/RpiR family transcriptional regulator [bacterium]
MKAPSELEKKVVQALPTLAGSQRKIAEFFLENRDLLPLLPIHEVAKRVDVSEATVVRFTQALGYKGYKELKDRLSVSLEDRMGPVEKYQQAITKSETTPDVLHLVAQNVAENINDTIHAIDPAQFSRAVHAIIHARSIYSIGLELSYHFASVLTYMLRLYAYDAHQLNPAILKFKEQVAYLKEDDLLICFSFSPYSRETIEAVQYAKERGITIIAFTDTKVAPIREYASICLQIRTDNIMFTNSLGAVTVVLNAIITELNFKDKERTLKSLKIIEENIKDDRYFVT